ncbi:MAG: zf-HC2 domain-containing protein [Candidatus Acidiferrum sp.]|jgi:anti-sigma factor RsiW
MSCDRAETVLHAYFDQELDPVGAAEFERHLDHCPECTASLTALQSLRSSITGAQLYQRAPALLRNKVLADLSSSRPAIFPRRSTTKWLALAAALLLFAIAGWQFFVVHRATDKESVLAAAVVDAHLRSLQPGHLTDVLSTDQHTVKPWFDGKLDFSPPVRDFAGQGYPLQGGRLDVVQGRTIAALVYGRHKHEVSVFIWPTTETDAAPRSGSHQGYQWICWRKGGMEFYAVSDTAASDLEQLQQLFSPL